MWTPTSHTSFYSYLLILVKCFLAMLWLVFVAYYSTFASRYFRDSSCFNNNDGWRKGMTMTIMTLLIVNIIIIIITIGYKRWKTRISRIRTQLVHCRCGTGIAEVRVRIPIQVWIFFQARFLATALVAPKKKKNCEEHTHYNHHQAPYQDYIDKHQGSCPK